LINFKEERHGKTKHGDPIRPASSINKIKSCGGRKEYDVIGPLQEGTGTVQVL
jgi:hypothetical protein